MSAIARRKSIEFYAPDNFRETWNKFKTIAHRDGQNASQLIRIWITRYVQVKYPGNPQTPLTAFDPTHIDYHTQNQKLIKNHLLELARPQNNNLPWAKIMWEYRDISIMRSRIKRAEEMAVLLQKEGVKVSR